VANQIQIQQILSIAHNQRFIVPSSEDNPCFLGTINTANHLLFLLKQAEGHGLDNEQLAKRSGFHVNTIKVYMRALSLLGYVFRSESANRSPIKEGARKAVWFYQEE
jgi:hypothetical protein